MSVAKSAVNAIFGNIVDRYVSMIKVEINHAKADIERKLKQIGIGGALLAVAYLFGFVALPLFMAAAVAALSLVWPVWLSALVLGGAVLLIMIILAAIGVAKIKKNSDLAPTEQIENIKQMFDWA